MNKLSDKELRMYEELQHARNTLEAVPTRSTQLTLEASEMDAALGDLNRVIEDLTVRLQPLLRESEPSRNGGEKAISPPAVPLVAHLRQKRFVISNFTHRITDLIERLEL